MSADQAPSGITWRDIPAFAATVGAISIALAVSWQFGFFYFIDRKYLAFFSVEDILRNSLTFLPLTLFGFAVGTFAGTQIGSGSRALKWLTETKHPARELKIGIFVVTAYVLFFDSWPLLVVFQLTFTFFAIAPWLIERSRSASWWMRDMWFGFFILVQAFLLGASEASTQIKSEQRNYYLVLKSGYTMQVNLVRVTADSIFVLKDQGEMLVVPRSEIKLLGRNQLREVGSLVSVSEIWDWVKEKKIVEFK